MKFRLFISLMLSFCLLSCGQEDPYVEERPPHQGNEEVVPPQEPDDPGKPEDNPADRIPEGGPSTAGWTTETVSEGLNLYKFLGTEPATKTKQRIFVLDVDMSNPRYRFAFRCEPDQQKIITSDAQIKSGAVAALNATYERGSVFIKVDGVTINNIANNLISDAVDNWKSEAGAFMTSDGKIYLEHSGKGMDLTEQRRYYRKHTCANIFTSAPMLIDNYDPVGESFVPANLTSSDLSKLHSEHPHRHQGVTHPRSVIALSKDNHILLIAIDGRDGDYKGMSAKQVTQFLVYHFNPPYALNMDGGGSTALSINGKVVNKPSGGEERPVPTHFLIYDDQKTE